MSNAPHLWSTNSIPLYPSPGCRDSGTPATHCGLCAMCFAELTPARREDLIEAERLKNPPPKIVHPEVKVEHVTNYVQSPSARKLVLLAAISGALSGSAGAILVLWLSRY